MLDHGAPDLFGAGFTSCVRASAELDSGCVANADDTSEIRGETRGRGEVEASREGLPGR